MVDAARPGMGTGGSADLGRLRQASRGRKISFLTGLTARNALFPYTFGNSSHGGCAKRRQIKNPTNAGVRMSKFLRKPEAVLWVLSISQAAGMLVFNLLLRAAVS
jgi:hypothetical protein